MDVSISTKTRSTAANTGVSSSPPDQASSPQGQSSYQNASDRFQSSPRKDRRSPRQSQSSSSQNQPFPQLRQSFQQDQPSSLEDEPASVRTQSSWQDLRSSQQKESSRPTSIQADDRQEHSPVVPLVSSSAGRKRGRVADPTPDTDKQFRALITALAANPDKDNKTTECIAYVAKLAVFLEDLYCSWDSLYAQVQAIIEAYRKKDTISEPHVQSLESRDNCTKRRRVESLQATGEETDLEAPSRSVPSQHSPSPRTDKDHTSDRASLLTSPPKTHKKTPSARSLKTLKSLEARIQNERPSEDPQQAWDTFQHMHKELDKRDDITFEEEEYYHIGELVFCRMFGENTNVRLYQLLVECDSAVGSSTEDTLQRVELLVQKLQASNVPNLALFVKTWGEVADRTIRSGGACAQLRTHVRQYDLWKKWSELKDLCRKGSSRYLELQDFLAAEGFRVSQGKALDSCLAEYFAKELGLSKAERFADTVYCFTALGVLVDTFGLGVLVFVPKNMDSWYKQLRGGKQSTSLGSMKRRKVEAICAVLAERLPHLRRLCDAAKVSIVDRFLAGKPLELTTALKMVKEGKAKRDIIQLPVNDFVEGIQEGNVIEMDT